MNVPGAYATGNEDRCAARSHRAAGQADEGYQSAIKRAFNAAARAV